MNIKLLWVSGKQDFCTLHIFTFNTILLRLSYLQKRPDKNKIHSVCTIHYTCSVYSVGTKMCRKLQEKILFILYFRYIYIYIYIVHSSSFCNLKI
jgi:hypothetical protein